MKNRIIAGLAAIVAALALVTGGSLAATAVAPPTAVKASTASVSEGTAVFARLVRQPTGLRAFSGVYTDLSGTINWNLDQQGGFTFNDADGLVVPVDGLYELEWSAILNSPGQGIIGIALDGQTPNGGILQAIGPVVNSAAAIGNGSATIWLPAGTEVKLWGYGHGGFMELQTTAAVHWGVALIQ